MAGTGTVPNQNPQNNPTDPSMTPPASGQAMPDPMQMGSQPAVAQPAQQVDPLQGESALPDHAAPQPVNAPGEQTMAQTPPAPAPGMMDAGMQTQTPAMDTAAMPATPAAATPADNTQPTTPVAPAAPADAGQDIMSEVVETMGPPLEGEEQMPANQGLDLSALETPAPPVTPVPDQNMAPAAPAMDSVTPTMDTGAAPVADMQSTQMDPVMPDPAAPAMNPDTTTPVMDPAAPAMQMPADNMQDGSAMQPDTMATAAVDTSAPAMDMGTPAAMPADTTPAMQPGMDTMQDTAMQQPVNPPQQPAGDSGPAMMQQPAGTPNTNLDIMDSLPGALPPIPEQSAPATGGNNRRGLLIVIGVLVVIAIILFVVGVLLASGSSL